MCRTIKMSASTLGVKFSTLAENAINLYRTRILNDNNEFFLHGMWVGKIHIVGVWGESVWLDSSY